jgi:hypothetical protein
MSPTSEASITKLSVLFVLAGAVVFAFGAGQSVALLIDSETAQTSFVANGTLNVSWVNNSEEACADCLITPATDSEETSETGTTTTVADTTTTATTEEPTTSTTEEPTTTEETTTTTEATTTTTTATTEESTTSTTEEPTTTEETTPDETTTTQDTSTTTESSLLGGLLYFRLVAFGMLFGLLLRKT